MPSKSKPLPHDRLPLPRIFRFDHLLEQRSNSGLRRSSSILITGKPGMGKTFFALSLVREQMRACAEALVSEKEKGRLTLLYCGLDLKETTLVKNYKDFGWFEGDGKFGPDCQGYEGVTLRYRVLSVPEKAMPMPSIGAAELIQSLLVQIRDLLVARPVKDYPGDQYFVIIDNITSMLKGSSQTGERQRLAHELHDELRDLIKDRKQLCVFISDEEETGAPIHEKDSQADFVFQLGKAPFPGGLERRTLMVRKCPAHTPLVRGPHSWAIVTKASIKGVVASKELGDKIRADRKSPKPIINTKEFGVIAIFPAYQLPYIGHFQDPSWNGYANDTVDLKIPISTGVPGLDEMICGNRDYWASPTDALLHQSLIHRPAKALHAGSTTLLLGSAGSGKTNCCMAFLFENENTKRSLYVNFENRPHRVYDLYPGVDKIPQNIDGKLDDVRDPRNVLRLFLRRAEFDLNVFVNELTWLVENQEINRIAFDGLSDLAAIMSNHEYELLIELLVISVRQAAFNRYYPDRKKIIAKSKSIGKELVTFYLALEEDPDRPSRREAVTDSPADNVIVFRQVQVHNERRKTVEVRKARGQSPDKQVRELVILQGEQRPLRIIPGLDNYRGLGSGSPEPVRVALQLISYNHQAEVANKRLAVRLESMFGYTVRYFGFTRAEVVRTLGDIATGVNRIPMAEVKLLNVDEWWVRELRACGRRAPGRTLAQSPHPLLRLNRFLHQPGLAGNPANALYHPMPTDFWAIEMEKCCVPVVVECPADENDKREQVKPGITTKDDKHLDTHFRADVVGLPSFANYGVFCLNREIVKSLNQDAVLNQDNMQNSWRDWLNKLPRVWAQRQELKYGKVKLQWFRPPGIIANGEEQTVVDYIRELLARASKDSDIRGFSFDLEHPVTASCAFMEFCWAYGAGENIFIQDVAEYFEKHESGPNQASKYLASHPVTWALKFLMYLVAEGLMAPRSSLRDARRSIFSRVWFLGLSELDAAARPKDPVKSPTMGADSPLELADEDPVEYESRAQAMQLLPLPFFPCGALESHEPGDGKLPSTFHLAFQDTLNRFHMVLKRIEVAMDYRLKLISGQDDIVINRIVADMSDIRKYRQHLADKFNTQQWDFNGRGGHLDSEENLLQHLRDLLEICDKIDDIAANSRCFEHGRGYERKDPVPQHATGSIFEPNYPLARDLKAIESEYSSEAGGLKPEAEAWRHLPYAMFMDLRDIRELMSWQRFRLRSLQASLLQIPFGDFLANESNPLKGSAPETLPSATTSLSGYTCEGTWIVAADRTTHSPSLSAKLLDEMTATAMTTERGKLAAGIPVRKDFYEEHGDQTVPCQPEKSLTWKKLLKYLGARSYRRGRTFCARVRVTYAYEEMVRHLLQGLTLADHLQSKYKAKKTRAEAIQDMDHFAMDAVQRLFTWFRDEMRAMAKHDQEMANDIGPPKPDQMESTCVTCPHAEKCRSMLKPLNKEGAR